MADKSLPEEIKDLWLLGVENYRRQLAEKILLNDVRARGAQHACMADRAVEHADELIEFLSHPR